MPGTLESPRAASDAETSCSFLALGPSTKSGSSSSVGYDDGSTMMKAEALPPTRNTSKASLLERRRPSIPNLADLQVETQKVQKIATKDLNELGIRSPTRRRATSSSRWEAIDEAVRETNATSRRRSDSCMHRDEMKRASLQQPLSPRGGRNSVLTSMKRSFFPVTFLSTFKQQ